MVAGRLVFCHPSFKKRGYILDKLMVFHRAHHTTPNQLLADAQAAIEQIPRAEHQAEAQPLAKTRTAGRRGPQPIGEILPLVLARLTAGRVQLEASGESDPR